VEDVQAELDRIKEEQDEEGYQTDYPTNRTVVIEDEQLLEEQTGTTEQGT
jgi:flagellar biosynthesis/type III secretory pathway M-ring protein FliF/YscJ